jgi:hypothetical protein
MTTRRSQAEADAERFSHGAAVSLLVFFIEYTVRM